MAAQSSWLLAVVMIVSALVAPCFGNVNLCSQSPPCTGPPDDGVRVCTPTYTLGQLNIFSRVPGTTYAEIWNLATGCRHACYTMSGEGSRAGPNYNGGAPNYAVVCTNKDTPVTAFTGASQPSSSDWMSIAIASDQTYGGNKLGTEFHLFCDRLLWIVMPMDPTSFRPSTVTVTDLSDGDDSVILNPSDSRYTSNVDLLFEGWHLRDFEDDNIKIECSRPCLVQQGDKGSDSSTGWAVIPGSVNPGEGGGELGTKFHWFAHNRMTIWGFEDGTDVAVKSVSGSYSFSFSLNADQYWCSRTTAPLSASSSPRTQVPGPNVDFGNQFFVVTSSKPVMVQSGPALAGDGGFTLDQVSTEPIGPAQHTAFVWGKNRGFELLTFDKAAEVTVEAIAGATYRSFSYGPSDWQPVGASSMAYYIPSPTTFTGELMEIVSTRPLTAFYGDYAPGGCCSAAFVPVVDSSPLLPPVARVTDGVSKCPVETSVGFTFSGAASFDQDLIGDEPSIKNYTWTNVRTGEVLSNDPEVFFASTVVDVHLLRLTIFDNDDQTDSADVRFEVLECCSMGVEQTGTSGVITDGSAGSPCSWTLTLDGTPDEVGVDQQISVVGSLPGSGYSVSIHDGTDSSAPSLLPLPAVSSSPSLFIAFSTSSPDTRESLFSLNWFPVPTVVTATPLAAIVSAGDTSVLIRGSGFAVSELAKCRYGSTVVPAFFRTPTEVRCTLPAGSTGTNTLSYSNDGETFWGGIDFVWLSGKPAVCQEDDVFSSESCCHGSWVSDQEPCRCDDGWVGNACEFRGTQATGSVSLAPPHFQSFDGSLYDHFPVGESVLVRMTHPLPFPFTEFELLQRTELCLGGHGSCIVAVSLTVSTVDHPDAVYCTVVTEEAPGTATQQVFINGQPWNPPREDDDGGGGGSSSSSSDSDASIILDVSQPSTTHTILSLPEGLTIELQARTVFVTLPPLAFGNVDGLLSNFDLNPDNDLPSSGGGSVDHDAADAAYSVPCTMDGMQFAGANVPPCQEPPDDYTPSYVESLTDMFDQLDTLGSDAREAAIDACNAVLLPSSQGLQVDCQSILNDEAASSSGSSSTGVSPSDQYLIRCLQDMFLFGNDPSALLATASAFASQCESTASTTGSDDPSATPGTVVDVQQFDLDLPAAGFVYLVDTDSGELPGWAVQGSGLGVSDGSSGLWQHGVGTTDGNAVFFQGDNAIQHLFSGLLVGTEYVLSWKETRRSCNPSVCPLGDFSPNRLRVDLDDDAIDGPRFILEAAWVESEVRFTATKPAYTVSFVSVDDGDRTFLIDQVALTVAFSPLHSGSVVSCPNFCSFRGSCNTDDPEVPVCDCPTGWTGSDCSLPFAATSMFLSNGYVLPFDGGAFPAAGGVAGQRSVFWEGYAADGAVSAQILIDAVPCASGVCLTRVSVSYGGVPPTSTITVTIDPNNGVHTVDTSSTPPLPAMDGFAVAVDTPSEYVTAVSVSDGTRIQVSGGTLSFGCPPGRFGGAQGGLVGSYDADRSNDRVPGGDDDGGDGTSGVVYVGTDDVESGGSWATTVHPFVTSWNVEQIPVWVPTGDMDGSGSGSDSDTDTDSDTDSDSDSGPGMSAPDPVFLDPLSQVELAQLYGSGGATWILLEQLGLPEDVDVLTPANTICDALYDPSLPSLCDSATTSASAVLDSSRSVLHSACVTDLLSAVAQSPITLRRLQLGELDPSTVIASSPVYSAEGVRQACATLDVDAPVVDRIPGQTCSSDALMCSGHGACVTPGTPSECTCVDGWDGDLCDRPTFMCGNGILDEFEMCDPGLVIVGRDGMCCSDDCTLQPCPVAPVSVNVMPTMMWMEDSTTELVFTRSDAAKLQRDVTIRVWTEAGTASAESGDYEGVSKLLTLQDGRASVSTTLSVLADGLTEDVEEFTVHMAVVAGPGALLQDSFTVIIPANDAPTFSMAWSTPSFDANHKAELTVTRTGPVNQDVAVAVSLGDGSQPVGLSRSVLLFPADGDVELSIDVSLLTDDDAVSGDVTLVLDVLPGYDATVNPTAMMLAFPIATVTASVSAASVSEGGSVELSFTLDGPSLPAEPVLHVWTSSSADITPVDTIVGPSHTVTIPVLEDDLTEDDAVFTLHVDVMGGFAVLAPASPSSFDITIPANELPTISMTVSPSTAAVEEGTTVDVDITRSGPTNIPVVVEVQSSDTSRVRVEPSLVTVPVGETSVSTTAVIVDNSLAEPDLDVTLTAVPVLGTAVSSVSASITVAASDDPTFSIDFASGQANEVTLGRATTDTVTLEFEVTRHGSFNGAVDVLVSSSGPGIDGVWPQEVSFADGQATAALSVTVAGDIPDGADTYDLSIGLSDVTFSVRTPPLYSVQWPAGTTFPLVLHEGQSEVLTIQRTAWADEVSVLELRFNGGGPHPPAGTLELNNNGGDGVLYFAPGVTELTQEFVVADDHLPETAASVTVALVDPLSAVILTEFVVDIPANDHEPHVALSVAEACGIEGDTVTVTITRTGGPTEAVSVKYWTSATAGTAVPDTDFRAIGETEYTFPPMSGGEMSQTHTFVVKIVDDLEFEGAETVGVMLTATNPSHIVDVGSVFVTIAMSDVPAVELSMPLTGVSLTAFDDEAQTAFRDTVATQLAQTTPGIEMDDVLIVGVEETDDGTESGMPSITVDFRVVVGDVAEAVDAPEDDGGAADSSSGESADPSSDSGSGSESGSGSGAPGTDSDSDSASDSASDAGTDDTDTDDSGGLFQARTVASELIGALQNSINDGTLSSSLSSSLSSGSGGLNITAGPPETQLDPADVALDEAVNPTPSPSPSTSPTPSPTPSVSPNVETAGLTTAEGLYIACGVVGGAILGVAAGVFIQKRRMPTLTPTKPVKSSLGQSRPSAAAPNDVESPRNGASANADDVVSAANPMLGLSMYNKTAASGARSRTAFQPVRSKGSKST